MNKRRAYVWDVDGTIADITHRRHFVASKPKNWPAFEKGIPNDVPNQFVVDVMQDLQRANSHTTSYGVVCKDFGSPAFILCSGRGEQQRKATEDWMQKYDIEYDALYMRAEGDYRRDDVVKPELWKQIEADGYEIIAMFDDRKQVVDKARELGYKVFQVAEGNF